MNYLPTRIMVPLPNDLSKAIRRETDKRRADDPRKVVSALIRERLEQLGELAPLCPQCNYPTIEHPDPLMVDVLYCPYCQESVAMTAAGNGGKE